MFDDDSHARAAANDLADLGVNASNVTVTRSDHEKGYMAYQGIGDTKGSHMGGGIAGFFRRLFGTHADDRDTGLYAEAVRRGTTVVTATIDENLVDNAAQLFERHGAVDIDRRASQYQSAGYTNFDESAPIYTPEQSRQEWETFRSQGDVAVPVIEEQLQVGKRTVRRGGVRVHTHMVEHPVDEVVTLREEHVRVDRRPVSREATEADLDAMKDRTVEVTESAEEAVVAKQARVVEEVVVGKDVEERESHIRDKVRRTDVDVEHVDDDDRSRQSDRNSRDRGAAL